MRTGVVSSKILGFSSRLRSTLKPWWEQIEFPNRDSSTICPVALSSDHMRFLTCHGSQNVFLLWTVCRLTDVILSENSYCCSVCRVFVAARLHQTAHIWNSIEGTVKQPELQEQLAQTPGLQLHRFGN